MIEVLKRNMGAIVIAIYGYIIFFKVKESDYKSMILLTVFTSVFILQTRKLMLIGEGFGGQKSYSPDKVSLKKTRDQDIKDFMIKKQGRKMESKQEGACEKKGNPGDKGYVRGLAKTDCQLSKKCTWKSITGKDGKEDKNASKCVNKQCEKHTGKKTCENDDCLWDDQKKLCGKKADDETRKFSDKMKELAEEEDAEIKKKLAEEAEDNLDDELTLTDIKESNNLDITKGNQLKRKVNDEGDIVKDIQVYDDQIRIGAYDGLCLASIEKNKYTSTLSDNEDVSTQFGHILPLVNTSTDDDVLTGPSIDGKEDSPKKLSMFANNKVSLNCCGESPFQTSRGCVCLSKEQKEFIQNRGFNKKF